MRPKIQKTVKKISFLVTAGPTREKIDPVRFISNYSTGAFGYEIARQALRMGHRVLLVSGPTALKAPRGASLIRVESAVEMRDAVKRKLREADCVIMAAAVSDWRVKRPAGKKIKKHAGKPALELVKNPDILYEIGRKHDRILVGFALETEDLAENAVKKLKEKNLDLIIANRQASDSSVFGEVATDVLMIDRFGRREKFRRKSKRELAKIILDRVLSIGI